MTLEATLMRIDQQPYAAIGDYLAENDTILIPVGAVEQYGPHLAIGTELRIVETIAQEAAERAGLVFRL